MNVKKLAEMFRKNQDEVMNLLKEGKINYLDLDKMGHFINFQDRLSELEGYKQKGDFKSFCDLALQFPCLMPIAFKDFDIIPDELKFWFAIEAYSHHGDKIPTVRKAIRKVKKYRVEELPKEISSKEFIEIYRAGEEPKEKAKYRISWTTEKAIAEFFFYTYGKRHAKYLYKGKIKSNDIIAFYDGREEKEILQYGKVYDIEVITELKEREQ